MSKEITVKLKKLDERAVIPSYAHEGDVGMDMTAISVEYDEEKDMYIYHTGLAFESDFNIGQFLFVRSSNSKTEAYLCNHVGIADSAIYRGEIQFRFKNRDSLKSMIVEKVIDEMIWVGGVISYESYGSIRKTMLERARKLEFAPYNVGDRIGQMVFLEYPTVKIEVVDELSDTARGAGGFGSTGK